MSKHIVIDAREYSSSSGRYIRKLLFNLEQIDTGYRYTVLLHSKDINAYQPKAANFTKLIVPYEKFTFAEQIQYPLFLYRLKPDLVHFTFANQPILYRFAKVTAVLDLTATRFNLALGINRLVSPIRRKIYRFVVSSAVRHSRRVITISNFVKDDLVKTFGAPASRISVTYSASDHINNKPIPISSLQGTRFIMYVGRVQSHKNIVRLIDAFRLLRVSHPELKLVLVGKKDLAYESLEKYVARTKGEGIVFTDFVSDAELKWLYQRTSAYVFPSLSEGFGLPALEAMQHGAPVVSSNATCLPEIYEDAALYFNPLNIEDMATKIDRVITDTNFRKVLISKGRQQAKKFSWRTMAEQTLDVYTSVLNKRRRL